jgi:hypothetical protein
MIGNTVRFSSMPITVQASGAAHPAGETRRGTVAAWVIVKDKHQKNAARATIAQLWRNYCLQLHQHVNLQLRRHSNLQLRQHSNLEG